jgi:hypothetical protein
LHEVSGRSGSDTIIQTTNDANFFPSQSAHPDPQRKRTFDMTKHRELPPGAGPHTAPDKRIGDTNDTQPGGEGNSHDDERGQPGLDRPGQGNPGKKDALRQQLEAMKAIDA